MREYRIKIIDELGLSMQLVVRLATGQASSWRTIDKGFFSYENGIADDGRYPTSPLSWLALYGGDEVDDSKLILHLDDFCSPSFVNRSGNGKVYWQDFILMKPGAIRWELIG
ncbi:MAG: hypothetical protein U0795_18670 [Pirellulales bacterium]